MKWYQIAGDWQQFTAKVKEEWNKLTDEDLTTFGGQSDQLTSLSSKSTATRESRRKNQSPSFLTEKSMNSISLLQLAQEQSAAQ